MKSEGFTITELIVVIAIMSILLAISTLEFSSWQKKNFMEKHTKELYTDLQDIRMKAAFTKIPHRAVFSGNQVSFQQFVGAAWIQAQPGVKTFPYNLNRPADWTTDNVEFDTRGIVNSPIVMIVCLGLGSDVDASYDAVIITSALTNMGKIMNRGGQCARTNVEQK